MQFHVAFEFFEQVLFELAHHALVIEQVADKKKRERAKAEKRHAQGPLVSFGMHKNQRVHERRQAGGQHQYKHHRQNGELQLPPLQVIEFRAIQFRHDPDPEARSPT